MTIADDVTGAAGGRAAEWNWRAPLPIKSSPLFQWPLRPMESVKWFARAWHPISDRPIIALLAVISWLYFQPALDRCATFEFDWIAQMFARNMVLMVVVAGGLHLYLYTFGKQGSARQFDTREMERNSPRFTWGDQVRDNMFWTCASGVTIWTAFEVLFMWAFANDYIAVLDWRDQPVWFALCFVLAPVWSGVHFFVIHCLLHWPPLYKAAHALHHRNSNIGPWSGMSMHPIEHVMYLSSVLILWVVPAHPVHVLFLMQYLVLTAATSHCGYEKIVVGETRGLRLGDYFHQLHHRYFECNYGTPEVPLDEWTGAFHDGTPEATRRLRESRRKGFAG
jgi:sterol desaturase/sphingolipid hydroxylase (fatty acid hydroxylase superfamily)